MARHAGFAAAVTVTEAYLNQTLWVECQKLDPIERQQLFRVPSEVPLAGGKAARLSGLALFEQRPTVSLTPNPANTMTVQTSAIAYINAAFDDGPDRTWKVRISAVVQVGADVEVAQDGLYLRWLPAGSSVGSLGVTALDGAPVPQFLVDALNSAEMRGAMNAALQAVGPVRVSGRLFPRVLRHVQEANFKATNFSVFEWFTIDIPVTAVNVRVLDGCLAVGIDVQNFPPGDSSQLVDLNTHLGDSVQYFGNDAAHPILVAGSFKQASGDIAVLVNSDFVRGVVDNVSGQISGTPVVPHVRLTRLTMQPVFFNKPLRGREIALKVDVTVNVDAVGDIVASLYLQFFSKNNVWSVYVGNAEIDAPWWVDAAVAVAGTVLALVLPAMLAPLIAIGVIAAISDIIPAVIGNVTAKAQDALGGGEGLAAGWKPITITGPHGDEVTSDRGMRSMHLSTEGLGMTWIDVIPSVRFGKQDATADIATLTSAVAAGDPAPYTFSLALRPDLAALAGDCTARIVVTRADNGAEVGRYEGSLLSNALAVDHLTSDLYFVDTFGVRASIFLNKVGLEGLLFDINTMVTATDTYNRHHPFVTWLQHTAYFPSPDDAQKFWARKAHPSIHRTAASARCLALRQRAKWIAEIPNYDSALIYRDALEIDFSQIAANRKGLCDYCFFGGPTRTEPFPQEDWFKT